MRAGLRASWAVFCSLSLSTCICICIWSVSVSGRGTLGRKSLPPSSKRRPRSPPPPLSQAAPSSFPPRSHNPTPSISDDPSEVRGDCYFDDSDAASQESQAVREYCSQSCSQYCPPLDRNIARGNKFDAYIGVQLYVWRVYPPTNSARHPRPRPQPMTAPAPPAAAADTRWSGGVYIRGS